MNDGFRARLVVICAVLLPLPLLGIFAMLLMKPVQDMSRDQEPTVIAMLHPVEREGTLTYGRKCLADSDCDSRLRCFFSMVLQYSYCTDSRCTEDKHCPTGFSCQTYTVKNRKESIQMCSRVGLRKEGEGCEMHTIESDSGCERGLVCQRWCGRACTAGSPDTCPEGFFCSESREGSACQPTCEGQTCPEGQRCVQMGGRVSVCARVHGTDCQSNACGPGQRCSARTYPWAPGEAWMQCTQRCELPGTPPCPEGTACAVHHCRPVCSPDGGAPCAERFECTHHPNQPAICTPDVADRVPP